MKCARNAFILAAGLVAAFVPAVYADKPEDRPGKPPAGMAKYYLFLRQAPPVHPGQKPKKIEEPDVAKLGGQVLHAKDNYRVIFLPPAAVRHLRENENVDYVQRVWMGEPLETWEPIESAQTGRQLTTMSDDEGPTWGPKAYAYDGSGNIRQIGTDLYSYDAVSRLRQAVVNGQTESYEYDSFGNLTRKQVAGQPASTFTVDSASNRIANATYDIAGNVTFDGRRSYWYDSMGMMSAVTGGTGLRRMYYTADDERIGIQVDATVGRWKIRDFEGRVLREFRTDTFLNSIGYADWFWTEDYVYAGGQLVGGETAGPWGTGSSTVSADNRRRHYHLDHLGTVRLVTTDARVSLGVHHYYPFGAEQSVFYQEEATFGGLGMIRPEPMRFTGHERDFNGLWNVDNNDYLDYMHARYYDPQAARFLSVDPVLDVKRHLRQPQGWNRYAYVLDNPVNAVDPDGRETFIITTFDYGVGSHSAVLVSRKGSENVLYDPAGSYVPPGVKAEGGQRGSGDMFYGQDADLGSYVKYQEGTGSTVRVLKFDTNPRQEAQIKNRIEQRPGSTAPGACAQAVCSVVTGIGPFKDVKPTTFPGRLYAALVKIFRKEKDPK